MSQKRNNTAEEVAVQEVDTEDKTEQNKRQVVGTFELVPSTKEFFEDQVDYLGQRLMNSLFWATTLVAVDKMGEHPSFEDTLLLGPSICLSPDSFAYNREVQDSEQEQSEPSYEEVKSQVHGRRGISGKAYDMLIEHSKTYLEMQAIIPEFKLNGFPVRKSREDMYAETLKRAQDSSMRNRTTIEAKEVLRREALKRASKSQELAI